MHMRYSPSSFSMVSWGLLLYPFNIKTMKTKLKHCQYNCLCYRTICISPVKVNISTINIAIHTLILAAGFSFQLLIYHCWARSEFDIFMAWRIFPQITTAPHRLHVNMNYWCHFKIKYHWRYLNVISLNIFYEMKSKSLISYYFAILYNQ